MTAPFYRFSEFDGEEDAADEREAWFIARRQFEDGEVEEWTDDRP